jgi:hypothetical protein
MDNEDNDDGCGTCTAQAIPAVGNDASQNECSVVIVGTLVWQKASLPLGMASLDGDAVNLRLPIKAVGSITTACMPTAPICESRLITLRDKHCPRALPSWIQQ